MTGRDDLEAVIRRELQQVATAAFNPSQRYVTGRMNAATDAILAAAEQFSAAVSLTPAERRRAVALAAPRADAAVHYAPPGVGCTEPACGKTALNPLVTSSRAHVTCASCKRTRAWRPVLAEVSAPARKDRT